MQASNRPSDFCKICNITRIPANAGILAIPKGTEQGGNITRIPANAGTVSQLVEYLGQGYIT